MVVQAGVAWIQRVYRRLLREILSSCVPAIDNWFWPWPFQLLHGTGQVHCRVELPELSDSFDTDDQRSLVNRRLAVPFRRKRRPASSLPLLVTFISCLSVWVYPAQSLRDPLFMKEAEPGLSQIFNMDYDQAVETFSSLNTAYPQHPAPLLYMATAVWLRELYEGVDLNIDKFIAPGYLDRPSDREMPSQEKQAFLDLVEESQGLAEAILKEEPKHKDARYFLGSCYGLSAAFALTIDRSRNRAFKEGRKAYKEHKRLLEVDPDYYDAYLSVGLYEYIVGNLPWYVKWLAALIGFHGSGKRGLEYLSLAAEKGSYVADEARALQMVLWMREKEFDKALERARSLHQEFPRSWHWYLNQAQILEKMGSTETAADMYLTVLRWAEEGRPNYAKIKLPVFRFVVGEKLMELKRPRLALEQFERLLENPQTPEQERALSHLRAGQILDLQGRRTEAVAHYTKVLEIEEFDDPHKRARNFLRKPYSGR